MTFLSYAQNFEDVMLHRALHDVECGFYIDVGAQHPVDDSVTKAFYERGWRGINVDPVPQWFKLMSQDRPHDINLQLALGATGGSKMMFAVADTGLSTDNEAFVQRHIDAGYRAESFEVDVSTLDEVCEQHNVSNVHFLKIDVEGAELDVIQGCKFDRVRPWIVLIEAIEPVVNCEGSENHSATPNYQAWEPILIAHRYVFAYDDGLNRFYVAEEKRDLLQYFTTPPNPIDGFVRYQEQIKHNRIVQLDSEVRALMDVSAHAARTVEVGELRRQLHEKQSAFDDINRDAANRLQRIIVVEQENAVLRAQKSQQLADIERLQRDQQSAQLAYENLDRDAANRLARLIVLEQENTVLHAVDAERRNSLNRLESEFGRLCEGNAATKEALDLLSKRHVQQTERSDHLNAEIRSLLVSRSWRLTRPLRAFRRVLDGRRDSTGSGRASDARAGTGVGSGEQSHSGKLPKRLKGYAVRMARTAFRHPSVGRIGWRVLSIAPKTKARLVLFIQRNHAAIHGPVAAQSGSNIRNVSISRTVGPALMQSTYGRLDAAIQLQSENPRSGDEPG